MNKLVGLLVVLLSFIGISAAQHRDHGQQDHGQSHRQPQRQEQPRHEARGRHEARREEHHEYRQNPHDYDWHHRNGWHFLIYVNIGPRYCHPYRYWDHRYLTLWDNTRWLIVDYDIRIVDGWYPSDPIIVYRDDAHYGWYLLYNQRTGEAVYAELW